MSFSLNTNVKSPSPPSPPSPVRARKPTAPPGFRAIPKPKQRPVEQMTVRELQDLYDRNAKILTSPVASTSSYVQRISTEQAAVEARLIELVGMESIQTGLKHTKISGEEDMNVDQPFEPPVSRTIEAKKKALSRFAPANGTTSLGTLSLQEAIELEQRAHALSLERQRHIEERKKRLGLPVKGETRQEREARIWAFMNHKPSESDLEDDDEDDDDDDDDPATWFEDDQDDGIKGQDLVQPDAEDLVDIIRIDESRFHYSTFYEPRHEGD